MSCKSCIYAANTATQSISDGGTINFGSAVRRYGSACNVEGGNLTLNGAGYYDISVNVTIAGTAAGTAVVQLYKDGVIIPGASASLTTAADTTYSASVSTIIRKSCCCESSITAVVSGVAVSVTSASITSEKV